MFRDTVPRRGTVPPTRVVAYPREPVRHGIYPAAVPDIDVGPAIGYAVGVGGIVLTIVQSWTERRRSRPVVIANEAEKRGIDTGPTVYITNDSSVVAFNIRYGVNYRGVYIPWKHHERDQEASRVNVLGAKERIPPGGAYEIPIPDLALWSMVKKRWWRPLARQRPVDEGRFYWTYYHGPGGDWWYTKNPASRSEDLEIKRLRFGARGWRKRRLDRAVEKGEQVLRRAVAELHAGGGDEEDAADSGPVPPVS